ncbi:MAG TPA: protein translocase subunit SecD [Chloroflexota bacterium]|nr:protein translocase subunit SecD [Chloroflexota bacterium]
MRRSTVRNLIIVAVIAVVAGWLAWPTNSAIDLSRFGINYRRDIAIKEGLDLQGGIQVLLQADVPPGQAVGRDALVAARQIVEQRVNALGVSEPVIQLAENNRIIVELPGVRNPDEAIKTFGNTGLLEFIDAGATFLPEGTVVKTSLGGPPNGIQVTDPSGTEYKTIVQGKHLRTAAVGFDELGRPQINFEFNDEGAKLFGDFTTQNVGRYLAITLDKRVISSPVIQNPIVGGSGRITGRFRLEEAQNIVIQLKYGALPVPLKVVQNRTVGPTLGQDSVRKSILAGAIGLAIVAGFMVLNYRLPGLLATLALVIYAAITFALFKTIPVVLTLAGIAGFILSIGMAVDANILIFERMKEELRAGRSLGAALDAGFARAWTSIRDSNVSTLITCAILYWFGATFGASIIQGFALTLALGVLVSMFTAIFVTRTLLSTLQGLGMTPVGGWAGLVPSVRPARG